MSWGDLAKDIQRRVAADVAAAGADPTARRAVARELIGEALQQHARTELGAGRPPPTSGERDLVAGAVLAHMFGAGPRLEAYLADEAIEQVDVNGPEVTWLTYPGGVRERAEAVASSNEELNELVRVLAARSPGGERRFDAARPWVDFTLPDGSRVSALRDVAGQTCVSIRRSRVPDLTLDDEVREGIVTEDLAGFLDVAVRSGCPTLVSGVPRAGKTSMIRALAACWGTQVRLITIEDTFELGLDRLSHRHPNCVAWQARPANLEGQGEVSMAKLVERSLRHNPDVIVVGETLGDEIVPLLKAMCQTRGALTSLHATSSAEALRRVVAYAAAAPERLSAEATTQLLAGALRLVVHMSLRVRPDGVEERFVASVREVVGVDGAQLVTNEVWRPGPDGHATPASPVSADTAARFGDAGPSPRRGVHAPPRRAVRADQATGSANGSAPPAADDRRARWWP